MSDRIWDFAESRFEEFQSAALQADYLKACGFRVTENLSGAPTAFVAEAGSGKPVIGYLGEFDALSGLSQQADCPIYTPP